ncbi:MAG: hypothetical protein ABI181_08260 [Mycobacteriaceae bacterium]
MNARTTFETPDGSSSHGSISNGSISNGSGVPARWGRLLQTQHRRQQRFAERTAHRLPGWRNRARRRAVVRVSVAALALMLVGVGLAATGLDHRGTAIAFAVAWLGGTVGVVAGWFVLRVLTSNVADLPADFLDEREALQRASARSVALTFILWAALVPTFLLVFGSQLGEASAVAYPAGLLLATVIIAGGFLPAMLLAWDAPDPDPEDTEPGDTYPASTDSAQTGERTDPGAVTLQEGQR